MTHLCGAGGLPAGSLGRRRGRLLAEAPVVAAAVRKRLSLQGLKGHGAHGVAGHWARTHRHGYGDVRGESLEVFWGRYGSGTVWGFMECQQGFDKQEHVEREIRKERKEWGGGINKWKPRVWEDQRRIVRDDKKPRRNREEREKTLVLLTGSTAANILQPSLGNHQSNILVFRF